MITFKPAQSTWDEIMKRRKESILQGEITKWDLLGIEKAKGSKVNLDYYSVKIEQLPAHNGKQMSPEELFDHIRRNLNDFIDNDVAEFLPYSENDNTKWQSQNPLDGVMTFHIGGESLNPLINIDDASVICSSYVSNTWIFSTIQNPKDAQHPVSGNRQFGLKNTNGEYVFFTRGADRLTGATDDLIGDPTAFSEADKLWKSLQLKIITFVNENKGFAKFDEFFSQRFDWKK
jgi:hypothetical protein